MRRMIFTAGLLGRGCARLDRQIITRYGDIPKIWIGIGLAVMLAGATGLSSCAASGDKVQAAVAEAAGQDPGQFTVPENQLPNLQLVPVGKLNWEISVHATGTVDWDADHTTQAIAQVSGPITRILVDTGSAVEVNTPLLYVSSPDVTNAIATYRKARNRLEFLTRALQRSKDLLDHKAIAQKDLESAAADCADAATDLQNAQQALIIFGVTAKDIDGAELQGTSINPELAVRSPIRGLVVQKLIFPGQLIQAGATTCFLISDPSTVWVQGHIYEKDLASVRIGDSVEVMNSSFPGVLRGYVSNIGAMIDPATRTTPVRIATSNPQGLLKKDLFVNLSIHTKTQRNILTVPASAVLYDASNLPFVYVQTGKGQFIQRAIVTGAQNEHGFEVVNGLKEGEKVVSAGAIFLQFANTYQK